MEKRNRTVLVDGLCRTIGEDGSFKETEASIYEVVRILDGRPVFLREHLERMRRSFAILGWPLPEGMETLEGDVRAYLARTRLRNGNLKLVLDRLDTGLPRSLVFEIPSRYPDESLYETGVDVITRRMERETPGAKRSNPAFRESVDRILARENAYEALLVDKNGYVTEGSRSNVFLVRDGRLLTPPAGRVLPGITRMKVMAFCRTKGIEAAAVPVKADSLASADGAFLSGTSIHLLPIRSIDGRRLAVTPFMRTLSRDFDAFVRSSTEGREA